MAPIRPGQSDALGALVRGVLGAVSVAPAERVLGPEDGEQALGPGAVPVHVGEPVGAASVAMRAVSMGEYMRRRRRSDDMSHRIRG